MLTPTEGVMLYRRTLMYKFTASVIAVLAREDPFTAVRTPT